MTRSRPETGLSPQRRIGSGIVADTPIETPRGPVPAESLKRGDAVLCRDGSVARIARIENSEFAAGVWDAWPDGLIFVPERAANTSTAFYLLPDQRVSLGSGAVSVCAAELVGGRGIMRVMPVDGISVLHIRLDAATDVEIRAGALSITCPSRRPTTRLRVPDRTQAASAA